MKVKDLMIYCTNRGCTGCEHDKECVVFDERFDCLPGIPSANSETFETKINILADYGNEEIEIKENL